MEKGEKGKKSKLRGSIKTARKSLFSVLMSLIHRVLLECLNKIPLLLITLLFLITIGTLGIYFPFIFGVSLDLIETTQIACALLIFISYIFTAAITFRINDRLLEGSKNKHSKYASTLNNGLALIIGGVCVLLLLYVFLSVIRKCVPLWSVNWATFIIALLIWKIDEEVKKSTENGGTNQEKEIFEMSKAVISYIDVPISVGIGIACFAGTIMSLCPHPQGTESYANGFTAGAIAMQVALANVSFFAISKETVRANKQGGTNYAVQE